MTREMVISYRFVRNPKKSSAADLASEYNLRVSPSLKRQNGNILQIYTHLKYSFAADLASAYNLRVSLSLRCKKWKYLTDLYAIPKISLLLISHLRIIRKSLRPYDARNGNILQIYTHLKYFSAADLAAAYNFGRVSVPMAREMVISYRFIRISKIPLPLISHLRII